MFLRKTILSSIIQILINISHVIFGLSLAYFFGATKEMDAYVVASNFIIALNAIFTSSQGNTLIPFISKYKDHPQQKDIIASVVRTNIFIFSFFSIIVFLFSKTIVFCLAPGLPPDQLNVSSNVLKILGIYILLSNVCGIGAALLDYQYKFEKRYLISLIQAIIAIVILLIAVYHFGIYSTPIAHVFSFLFITILYLFFLRKDGFSLKTTLGFFNHYLKEYFFLLSPIIMAWFFVWLIRFSDVFVASFLKSGSISYISYCQRINVYTSVIANVICSVYFPVLSKLSGSRKEEDFLKTFFKGLQTLFTVSLGISLFVFLFSFNIIEVLFERGNFFREDTLTVSSLLRYYFFVLLGAPIGAYLSNVYFAYHKTKLAMLYSILSSIINIVLNIVLGYLIGIVGLAIASSVAFLAGNIMQVSNIRRVNSEYRLSDSLKKISKPFFAGFLSLILFVFINNYINYYEYTTNVFLKMVYVGAGFISFFIVFLSLNYVLNVEIVREIVKKIIKR